jgi:hypothetical protein
VLTTEELRAKKRLIAAAGLIKVYDGQRWVDLRDVMTLIVDQTIELMNIVQKQEEEI